MVTTWKCNKCKLQLGVGTRHARGYFATLLPCKSCGTVHASEEGARIGLVAMPHPVIGDLAASERDESGQTIVVQAPWFPTDEWIRVSDRHVEIDRVGGTKALCNYCSKPELSVNWSVAVPCPNCQSNMASNE